MSSLALCYQGHKIASDSAFEDRSSNHYVLEEELGGHLDTLKCLASLRDPKGPRNRGRVRQAPPQVFFETPNAHKAAAGDD